MGNQASIIDPISSKPEFLQSVLVQLAPEPFEQVVYLVFLASFFLTLFWFLRFRTETKAEFILKWVAFASLPVSVVSLWLQSKSTYVLFEFIEIGRVLIVLIFGLIAASVWNKYLLQSFINRTQGMFKTVVGLEVTFKGIAIICVFLWTSFSLVQGVYTDSSMGNAYGSVTYHISFYVNEFAAILNGKTNLVDFFPQYQRLLSYFLIPVFKCFGLNFSTFTFSMVTLSLIGLFGIYLSIIKVTRHFWVATIGFLAMIGLSCRHVAAHGLERFYNFNYYGISPIRYFFCWMGFISFSFYVSKPNQWKKWMVLLVAAMGLLNNTDFGIFNFFGLILALIAFSEVNGKALIRLVTETLAALFLVFGLFSLFTYYRSGSFPDLTRSLFFQKVFASYGLSMVPMSIYGFQWMVIFVFMVAIGIGLVGSHLGLKAKNQKLFVLTLLSGIQGLGPLTYFVGRSMSQILIACFPAFGLSFLLIALVMTEYGYERKKQLRKAQSNLLFMNAKFLSMDGSFQIASVVMCFFLCLGLYQNLKAPTFKEEWDRFQLKNVEFQQRIDESVDFIKESVIRQDLKQIIKSGENESNNHEVVVISPFGHFLAEKAGFHNLFMYSELGSVFLKSQILEVEHLLDRRPLLFAELDLSKDTEWVEMINRQGYVKISERGRLKLFSKSAQ